MERFARECCPGAQGNVYAASGVSGGRGSFGYIIYVRPEDFDRAAKALDV